MNEQGRDLLVDLARLVRRYPPEAWDEVLEWLRDDARRDSAISIISQLASISKKTQTPSSSRREPAAIQGTIERIRTDDPVRASLLEDFWNKIKDRQILPTVSSVRGFAESAGLKIGPTRGHEQAARELILKLSESDLETFQDILDRTSREPIDFGRDYERWVKLILGTRTNPSPHRSDP
jgi:hypothetical protein